VVSGRRSMAARSAPVIAPATASVMPALHEAVTNPASARQTLAIAARALRCRSSISTNSPRIAATAATASGTTIEAPSAVIVPETLITGRRPSRLRMSAALTSGAEIELQPRLRPAHAHQPAGLREGDEGVPHVGAAEADVGRHPVRQRRLPTGAARRHRGDALRQRGDADVAIRLHRQAVEERPAGRRADQAAAAAALDHLAWPGEV